MGFPQFEKQKLHKIYVGRSNGERKHHCSILRNLEHKLLTVTVSIAFFYFFLWFIICAFLSCFSVILFSSMHIHNDINNINEKQRKSPFLNE